MVLAVAFMNGFTGAAVGLSLGSITSISEASILTGSCFVDSASVVCCGLFLSGSWVFDLVAGWDDTFESASLGSANANVGTESFLGSSTTVGSTLGGSKMGDSFLAGSSLGGTTS